MRDWNLWTRENFYGNDALLTLYRRERGSVSLSSTPGRAVVGDKLHMGLVRARVQCGSINKWGRHPGEWQR